MSATFFRSGEVLSCEQISNRIDDVLPYSGPLGHRLACAHGWQSTALTWSAQPGGGTHAIFHRDVSISEVKAWLVEQTFEAETRIEEALKVEGPQ